MSPTNLNPNVPSDTNFAWLVGQFIDVISSLVFLIFATVFVVLLWQIIRGFIINGSDAFMMKETKRKLLASIVMLILMVSVWGVVALVRGSII